MRPRRITDRGEREAILTVLDARCGRFEYLDENRAGYCNPGCAICHGPLRVTFRGQLVDLECIDGCEEQDVVAALFGAVR